VSWLSEFGSNLSVIFLFYRNNILQQQLLFKIINPKYLIIQDFRYIEGLAWLMLKVSSNSEKLTNLMEAIMSGYNNAATIQEQKSSAQPHNMTNQSLCGLVIFLLISMVAYVFQDFNLFEIASEPIRQILGYPPPAYLISVALAVYCFSSAILTLAAMANDSSPASKWNHLGYRSVFYVFYSFSGAISDNYIPVLLVGLSLYGLDQCHILIYNAKENHQGKRVLGKS
jgi:hypothetical protein